MRKTFAQVLKEGHINIKKEYEKLYDMIHAPIIRNEESLVDYISRHFMLFPYRGTCLDLEEFDEKYGFDFIKYPKHLDVDYLVSFCEYLYNLLVGMNNATMGRFDGVGRDINYSNFLFQINAVIDELEYMRTSDGDFFIFVKKSPAAIAVAESEMIPNELSYRVLEYNHQKLKGNLEQKKQIILQIASIIEAKEKGLINIAPGLKDNLSFALNNLNIRHNNIDNEGKHYKDVIAEMSGEKLEQLYDDTYNMCLLAILEIEYNERKVELDDLKRKIAN